MNFYIVYLDGHILDSLPFAYLGSPVPDTSADQIGSDSDSESDIHGPDDLDDIDEILDDTHNGVNDSEDISVTGIVASYLSPVKEKLQSEINSYGRPSCYDNNTFWIYPPDHFFALCKSQSTGLHLSSLYHPKVFVWLPEYFIGKDVITCQNSECLYYQDNKHPMTMKCWNDNPVACRVVGLNSNYYIIMKRIQCHKSKNSSTSGCGNSFNFYDPIILDQLDPGVVAEFPAFLTHRSGIDKTLMALIQAGISHRLSASAWSKIL